MYSFYKFEFTLKEITQLKSDENSSAQRK